MLGIRRPGLPPLAGREFPVFSFVPIPTRVATVPAPHQNAFGSDHNIQRPFDLDVGAPRLKTPVLKSFQTSTTLPALGPGRPWISHQLQRPTDPEPLAKVRVHKMLGKLLLNKGSDRRLGVVQFFEQPRPFDGCIRRYLALGGLGLLAVRQVLDEAS